MGYNLLGIPFVNSKNGGRPPQPITPSSYRHLKTLSVMHDGVEGPATSPLPPPSAVYRPPLPTSLQWHANLPVVVCFFS